uniref:Uncharacterized protein n=1 Tax=Rangifer tarandus platyrhynchus TaxID=3082113 RepID=A0ACB0FHN6_RANTA|nr:unnamed protein product [Rangifer tarandus platyrhynchus]
MPVTRGADLTSAPGPDGVRMDAVEERLSESDRNQVSSHRVWLEMLELEELEGVVQRGVRCQIPGRTSRSPHTDRWCGVSCQRPSEMRTAWHGMSEFRREAEGVLVTGQIREPEISSHRETE